MASLQAALTYEDAHQGALGHRHGQLGQVEGGAQRRPGLVGHEQLAVAVTQLLEQPLVGLRGTGSGQEGWV